MKGFDLTITLLEDAVFSERTATEGGHRGLPYIPGGALLGVAASRLYRSLKNNQETFTLFHSGKVRFGNGLPLDDVGEIAYPVPFCWHSLKDETYVSHGHIEPDKIHNLSLNTEQGERQFSQLRACFVTLRGDKIEPKKGLRMKTAIDPNTGQARTAALFGYDALEAGSKFRASIEIDDDVDDGLVGRLQASLSEKKLLLGRSRSAEYGKAEAISSGLTRVKQGQPDDSQSTLTLWLLSDLAATDERGQPTLYPKPQWLGLPKGELLLERSFVRTRRYSPWNAHRGGPDMERQVIVQGSVMVFELNAPLMDCHRQRLQAGLGSFREAGLGRIWVEPELLTELHPEWDKSSAVESNDRPVTLPIMEGKQSDLILWLEKQTQQRSGRQTEREQARNLAEKYMKLLESARILKGLDAKASIGPSASQWGSVSEAAKNAKNEEELYSKLFDDNDGCCKFKAPGWKDEFFSETHDNSFATWIREIWKKNPDRRLLQHLAREIQSILKEGKRS